MKRPPRPGNPPPRAKPESKPAWPTERHSGEGSASALEILQRLETRRRLATQSPDPKRSDDPDPGP